MNYALEVAKGLFVVMLEVGLWIGIIIVAIWIAHEWGWI